MATTDERSFDKEELEKIEGRALAQRAQDAVRSGAYLLPLALAAVLALVFSLTETDLGQILGAFLLVNSSKIFSAVARFAPKRG